METSDWWKEWLAVGFVVALGIYYLLAPLSAIPLGAGFGIEAIRMGGVLITVLGAYYGLNELGKGKKDG